MNIVYNLFKVKKKKDKRNFLVLGKIEGNILNLKINRRWYIIDFFLFIIRRLGYYVFCIVIINSLE